MKKSAIIIIVIITLLIIAAGVLVTIISKNAPQTDDGGFAVTTAGETRIVDMAMLEKIGMTEITLIKKTSKTQPAERTYTGLPLKKLFEYMDIEVREKVACVASDNFAMAYKPAEAEDGDNLFIAVKEDSEPFEEKDGRFVMVVRKDEFAMRWCKKLIEIKVD